VYRTARLLGVGFLIAAGAAAAPGGDERRGDGKIDYTRDVRPILANHCLLCHGPDAKGRKADLRLDVREVATAVRDGAAAIVPGKPELSALIQRVTTADADDVMPPPKAGKRLAPAQVDILRRWIAEGAPYARHWSFVKPERPPLPSVADAKWPRREIDRFVLARLEKLGLKPSPEADRHALIRRASLDLTGLPPSLEDVDRFVADPDPRAYEKLVDRLLESPAFGERWAKVWLDLARYADSQGYAEDRPRVIWLFRDWVIRALNANMPFDRFTIEQLAGDLLPDPTEEQLQATAFHRNTLTNTEGGTDDEEFRNAAVVDRVNTTLQVWMGLSFNCANCHDHKYDPFTQEEYFRVFAFFNNTEDNDQADDRPFLSLYTEDQKRQRKALEAEIAQLDAGLAKSTPELESSRRRWEAEVSKPVPWKLLKPAEAAGDGSLAGSDALTAVAAPGAGTVTAVRVETLAGEAKGDFLLSRVKLALVPGAAQGSQGRFVRLELPGAQRYLHVAEVQVFSGETNVAPKGKAKQSSTAFDGPAKLAIDGNTNGDYFAAKSVTHTAAENNPWWEVDLGKTVSVDRIVIWNRTDGGAEIMDRIKGLEVKLLDESRKPVAEKAFEVPKPSGEWRVDGVRELSFRSALADEEKPGFAARHLVEKPDPKKPGWSAGAGARHEVTFSLAAPVSPGAGATLRFRLESPAGRAPARVRLFVTDSPHAAEAADMPAEVRALLRKPETERTAGEAAKVSAHFRAVAPELAGTRDRLAAARKQLADLKPSATVPIMKELPEGRRRKTFIHIRGNWMARGKDVAEGVPSTFHPFPADAPRNRLGFAQWIVQPDNPLTARVAVNRHWEQLFGQGLVTTSEDWGVRGEMPSHPELLDWLATEFVARKWDVKGLLRQIVTSATYRQSSQVTPDLLAKDPSNRWLARGPRVRLLAEEIRDQALAVSGLLSAKMFGPSVYPPQPRIGLSAAFSGSLDWQTSQGEDKYRRGFYTFWRRSITYPSMAMFDAPDRNVCTVRRVPTNTPLQALVTLNDPVYVEAAQALARKIAAEGGKTPRERAVYAFRRCVSRPPRDAEADRLVALYEEARARYSKDAAKAKAMATDPLGPAPAGADVAELAAWTVVSNVLLNLDEMFLKR
jgi:mono/diheme cytochrome c family protein